jgi:hemerythrin-like domain-containing protein
LTATQELAKRISDHAQEAEAPGEFLDLIATQAPHLISAAKKLEAEHADLTSYATDLLDMVERLTPTDKPSAAEAIRQSALQLMGLLVRHRQQGADLVYLAYNEDLGSSG